MANGKGLSDFMPAALDRLLAQQSSSVFDRAFFGRPAHPAQSVFHGNTVTSNAPTARDNVLTIDKLHAAVKLIKAAPPAPKVYVSDAAVKVIGENFPDSRHRSKRIRKKLMRRFGGQHRTKPACLQAGDMLLIHPVLYDKMKRDLRQATDDAFMSAMFGIAVRK